MAAAETPRIRPVPHSPANYRLQALTGPQLGPQHHVTPMEQSAATSRQEAGHFERERKRVSARAAERLAEAERRHRAVLEQLEAERAEKQEALHRETKAKQAELERQEEALRQHLVDGRSRTAEHHKLKEQQLHSKREALQLHAQARREIEQNHAQTIRDLHEATQLADSTIANARADTRAKLDVLRQHRENLQAKLHEDISVRTAASRAFVEDMHAQANKRVLKSEAYRHSAAMTSERVGELAQASRSTAQRKAQLDEEKAAWQAAEMAKSCHRTQVLTDAAVKEQLQGSAAELQRARDHCARVKEEMAQAAAEYADKIRQAEKEHKQRDLEVESERLALEENRMEAFKGNCQAMQQADARFRTKRDACEAELEAVERRLREVEHETRQRAEGILAEWAAGNAAAEEAARELERRAEEALKEMQGKIAEKELAKDEHKNTLSLVGEQSVSALVRKANQVIDSTQATLEAARQSDERAAAQAMETWRGIRGQPDQIVADADAQVEAAMQRAGEEERRLQLEADARCEAARARAKAAQSEEQRLKAETSEAWARLRKAGFQLRLANLHDFAQGIVLGQFDVPQPRERVKPSMGTGLPFLFTATA